MLRDRSVTPSQGHRRASPQRNQISRADRLLAIDDKDTAAYIAAAAPTPVPDFIAGASVSPEAPKPDYLETTSTLKKKKQQQPGGSSREGSQERRTAENSSASPAAGDRSPGDALSPSSQSQALTTSASHHHHKRQSTAAVPLEGSLVLGGTTNSIPPTISPGQHSDRPQSEVDEDALIDALLAESETREPSEEPEPEPQELSVAERRFVEKIYADYRTAADAPNAVEKMAQRIDSGASDDVLREHLNEVGHVAGSTLLFWQLLEFAMRAKGRRGDVTEDQQEAIDTFVRLGGNPDCSGDIDASVLRGVIKEYDLRIDVDAMIKEVDEDDSGFIDFDEFTHFYRGLKTKISKSATLNMSDLERSMERKRSGSIEIVSTRRRSSTIVSDSQRPLKHMKGVDKLTKMMKHLEDGFAERKKTAKQMGKKLELDEKQHMDPSPDRKRYFNIVSRIDNELSPDMALRLRWAERNRDYDDYRTAEPPEGFAEVVARDENPDNDERIIYGDNRATTWQAQQKKERKGERRDVPGRHTYSREQSPSSTWRSGGGRSPSFFRGGWRSATPASDSTSPIPWAHYPAVPRELPGEMQWEGGRAARLLHKKPPVLPRPPSPARSPRTASRASARPQGSAATSPAPGTRGGSPTGQRQSGSPATSPTPQGQPQTVKAPAPTRPATARTVATAKVSPRSARSANSSPIPRRGRDPRIEALNREEKRLLRQLDKEHRVLEERLALLEGESGSLRALHERTMQVQVAIREQRLLEQWRVARAPPGHRDSFATPQQQMEQYRETTDDLSRQEKDEKYSICNKVPKAPLRKRSSLRPRRKRKVPTHGGSTSNDKDKDASAKISGSASISSSVTASGAASDRDDDRESPVQAQIVVEGAELHSPAGSEADRTRSPEVHSDSEPRRTPTPDPTSDQEQPTPSRSPTARSADESPSQSPAPAADEATEPMRDPTPTPSNSSADNEDSLTTKARDDSDAEAEAKRSHSAGGHSGRSSSHSQRRSDRSPASSAAASSAPRPESSASTASSLPFRRLTPQDPELLEEDDTPPQRETPGGDGGETKKKKKRRVKKSKAPQGPPTAMLNRHRGSVNRSQFFTQNGLYSQAGSTAESHPDSQVLNVRGAMQQQRTPRAVAAQLKGVTSYPSTKPRGERDDAAATEEDDTSAAMNRWVQ